MYMYIHTRSVRNIVAKKGPKIVVCCIVLSSLQVRSCDAEPVVRFFYLMRGTCSK
jgi:hypothetical protein